MESRPKKLLDQVRDAIRVKHDSYRTEQTSVQWIRRYILFHNKRHPNEISPLANEKKLHSFPLTRYSREWWIYARSFIAILITPVHV